MSDIVERAQQAFAAYRGLGKSIVDEMIAEISRLGEEVGLMRRSDFMHMEEIAKLTAERDEARARVAELEADNASKSEQIGRLYVVCNEKAVLTNRVAELEGALREAKGELQCQKHWLDRAVASDYRYRDDPALPGHRNAVDAAAMKIRALLTNAGEPPGPAPGFPGVIVLDSEEFDRVVADLQSPQPPTESIKQGAELLRQLYPQQQKASEP